MSPILCNSLTDHQIYSFYFTFGVFLRQISNGNSVSELNNDEDQLKGNKIQISGCIIFYKIPFLFIF